MVCVSCVVGVVLVVCVSCVVAGGVVVGVVTAIWVFVVVVAGVFPVFLVLGDSAVFLVLRPLVFEVF